MKNKQIILLLSIIAFFVSCTPKIVFNESLRNNLDLKSINPEKLQFYIDRTVELKREISSNSTKINAGKVEYYKGKNIQIISIKNLTPGVCLRSTDSTIDVAFENGSDAYLQFKKIKTVDSDFKIYMLKTTKNEEGKYFLDYNGISYQIEENAAEAKILIKRKVANKEDINTKNLKGRKVK
ncbi:MAG: hypothetical protein ACOYMA_04865 [Bacteroidia bacterium]